MPAEAIASQAAVASSVAALKGLQEIGLPTPVPYTPQTWGWLVVAAVVVGLVVWLIWRIYRHHKAQAWRRAALRELDRIAMAIQNEAQRDQAAAALPALVKRVALVSVPREHIASLSEENWLTWLDSTLRPGSFTSGPGRLLPSLAYSRQTPPLADLTALIALIRHWIGHHHARV